MPEASAGEPPSGFVPREQIRGGPGETGPRRVPAFALYAIRFVFAALYFLLARTLAHQGARGLVNEDWSPLLEQAMLVFLLLIGYAALGFALNRQQHPVSQQGLMRRPGWLGEAGLGLAFGWSMAVACVLPMLLSGGIALHFSLNRVAFAWLLADAIYFAVAALALQIAFRGYPFQCAIEWVGELPAALILAVLYGLLRAPLAGAGRASMTVSIALGLLLAMAYLRTRALWVPLGIQFGWVGMRALLFGLPVDGVTSHSPVLQGDSLGPVWLSGGDFGLDASWFALIVIVLAMPLLYRATGDLSFKYNAPVLVPGGIPVDLDAASRRQHEAATREAAPEVKPLVQISPVASPAPPPIAPDLDARLGSRSETESSATGTSGADSDLHLR